jgi:hypothetical protein
LSLSKPVRVVQCTRIEDLSDNAINIDYGYSADAWGYASLIRNVSFDPDDSRSVEFEYSINSQTGNENWLIWRIHVKEGGNEFQRWEYVYGAPEQADVYQPQYDYVEKRSVTSLIRVVPPEGNPWVFEYYDETTPLTSGPFLLKTVRTPRGQGITYTWGAETFDTGIESCAFSVPTFLAVQTRQTSVFVDDTLPWENMATSIYDYEDGGQEDATTTIVTTDSQTSGVLATEEHIFHGWSALFVDDYPDMWKVGLEKSSTTVIMDDAGEALQTVITGRVWQQSDSDEFSQDLRWSSGWAGCAGTRRSGYQKYVKPTSVTRVVKRHDSVPDPPGDPAPEPASYTTVTSEFDDFGNPGLITETSDDLLERTTHLTYWHTTESLANNQLSGFIEGRDADPGGLECRQYDSAGRPSHTFTNPQPAVVHEDDVSQCVPPGLITGAREIAFTYEHGNLATQTEVATPDSRITTHTNYKYGSPQDTVVATGTDTDIHYCRDYGPLGTVLLRCAPAGSELRAWLQPGWQ